MIRIYDVQLLKYIVPSLYTISLECDFFFQGDVFFWRGIFKDVLGQDHDLGALLTCSQSKTQQQSFQVQDIRDNSDPERVLGRNHPPTLTFQVPSSFVASGFAVINGVYSISSPFIKYHPSVGEN